MFTATVDTAKPPTVVKGPAHSDAEGQEVFLNWDRAMDDEGHLRRCPVCGCRELFVRKDFPQLTGFAIVIMAAGIALYLFKEQYLLPAVLLLAGVVIADVVIHFFTGRCLVCYRCRSEFRDLPIRKDHPGWDLAIGEKYRQRSYEADTVSGNPKSDATKG